MIESLGSLIEQSGQGWTPEAREYTPTSPEDPRFPLDKVFEFIQGGSQSHAGKTINETSALNLSTVLACCRVISNGLAMMPLITYRRTGDSGRERATDHYLYSTFKDSINPHMTAFRWKRLMAFHAVLHGNAYSTYDMAGNGRVINIVPVHPSRVRPVPQAGGGLLYWIEQLDKDGKPNGKYLEFTSERVFHVRGLESTDAGIGLSTITQAREAMGLGLATEEYGAKLFKGGALMQGYLKTPGKLSPAAQENLRQSFGSQAGGGNRNAHATPILEQGLEWIKVSIDPADAQFLESRKFNVQEICRWFGVQPHMVFDLERATHSNIEQQSIEWIRDCLGPWMENFEQEIEHTFLSVAERQSIYVEFMADVLLRADTASRIAAYATGLQNGIYSVNDVMQRENMNPVADKDGGNARFVNGTMTPISVAMQKTQSPALGAPGVPKDEVIKDQTPADK